MPPARRSSGRASPPSAGSTRHASAETFALRRLEVARERDVEAALMDKAIALFQKSLEKSAAKVEAEALRARAAEAEERVTTARDSEAARRRTSIEVMLAQKDAEEKRIAAQARAGARRGGRGGAEAAL